MATSSDQLALLIDSHLAGRPVDVPEELRMEFDQAVAAHGALRGIIDETLSLDPPAGPRPPPNVADEYDIERELGRGGMGVVYLARQKSLDRRVALKVLRPCERTFGPLVRRFLEEARHLARLRHPNIVSIHEVGDAEGEPYFTMDFIDGETLAAEIARGPLTPTRAVDVLRQVAAAVQHAHRHGVIHRDLKPGNVLLDRNGQVFVTDFGLARNLSQDSNVTQSGELLGTPQYMSPEQARGQTSLVGEPTDIHALGLLLFEMLAGRPAFAASSSADVLVKLLHEDPPPLRSIDRRIPRDLETICLKALQKSPSARYANVSALLEDLRRFEAGEPLLARRTSVFRRIARWALRSWKLTAAVVVTAAVVLAIAPRLFDKSVEELVAWGEEELREGRPEIAAEVFQRAWSHSDDSQRKQLAPRLAEAIRSMNDSRQAVDAALKLIEYAPDASFGKHDYLVAKAVTMQARAETPHGYFEPLRHAAPQSQFAKRELAARRLSIFLEGATGAADERVDAERTLRAIGDSMRLVRPTAGWTGDRLVKLPEGRLQELSQKAADASLPPWERGKAAIAVARLQEAAGDSVSALEWYRTALAELRRVYPFVAGVVSDFQIDADGSDTTTPDAPECRLVRDLLQDIRRLDPAFDDQPPGGVRIRLEHPELLGDASVTARLLLCDEAIADPHAGLHRNLSTSAPLSSQTPRQVRLLPGRYRLALAGTSFKWLPSPGFHPSLIELEATDWPRTITVADQFIDLAVSVRKLEEIKFTRPAPGERLDLAEDAIQWTPIAQAAKYDIQLVAYSDSPSPALTVFHSETSSVPEFRPASVAAHDRNKLRQNWPFGGTVGIRVAAFDAREKRLAISVEERRFLVAAPLPPD